MLDLLTPAGTGHYPLSAFRWALALQYPLWTVGAIQVLRWRRATKHRMAKRDPEALAALRRGVVILPVDA